MENSNQAEIDCINQAIREIAEELFKTGGQPDPEHMIIAREEIQCLLKRRESLYYAGRQPA